MVFYNVMYTVLCYTILYIMLPYVTLQYDMLCYVTVTVEFMICCVVLRYDTLHMVCHVMSTW